MRQGHKQNWKPSDWDKMSPVQCNEAVAVFAGWEKGPKSAISLGQFGSVSPMSAWHRRSDGQGHGWQDNPPDFMGDLNAIQKVIDEVIDTKNDCVMHGYIQCLLRACQGGRGDTYNWYDIAACANATAAQRCEAFFKFMTS